VREPFGNALGAAEFRLVEERPRPETLVLVVLGDVDLHTADELGSRLAAASRRRIDSVVVDLSAVTFVDSQGIGALLLGARLFGSRPDRFRLVVRRPEIRRVFEITSLDQILPLDPTREAALARLAPAGDDGGS